MTFSSIITLLKSSSLFILHKIIFFPFKVLAQIWKSNIVLFALIISWPFFSFVSSNFDNLKFINLQDIYVVLFLLFVVVSLISILSIFFLGKIVGGKIALVLISIIGIANFYPLTELFGFEEIHLKLTIWFSITATIVFFILRYVRLSETLRLSLTVGLLIANIGAINLETRTLIYEYLYPQANLEKAKLSKTRKPQAAVNKNYPNVYVMLLDGYLRPDKFDSYKHFGENNNTTSFFYDLEKYGFQAARKSFSNYSNTRLTIHSLFNFEYPVTEKDRSRAKQGVAFQLEGRFGKVPRKFKDMGYNIVFAMDDGPLAFGCGGDPYALPLSKGIGPQGNDYFSYCIGQGTEGIAQAAVAYMYRTPLLDLMRAFFPQILEHGRFTKFNTVANYFPIESEKPIFLFAHFTLPHLPGRYHANCTPKTILRNKDLIVHGKYKFKKSQHKAYRDNYLCANIMMKKFSKKISEQDPDAIVVFMSDHGVLFQVYEEKDIAEKKQRENKNKHKKTVIKTKIKKKPSVHNLWLVDGRYTFSDEALMQVFSNLFVVRQPDKCKPHFYEHISTINIFEMVFACIEGRKPSYFDDKAFLTDYSGMLVKDLTDLISSNQSAQRK